MWHCGDRDRRDQVLIKLLTILGKNDIFFQNGLLIIVLSLNKNGGRCEKNAKITENCRKMREIAENVEIAKNNAYRNPPCKDTPVKFNSL